MEQGCDDVEPPLHASGEGSHEMAAPIVQVGGREGLVDALIQQCAAEAIKPAEDPEVLLGGQIVVERDRLGNETQRIAQTAVFGRQFPAVEGDAAGVRLSQSGDKRHERALAGAVGTEEAKEFASRQFQRDAVESDDVAIGFADMIDGQHVNLVIVGTLPWRNAGSRGNGTKISPEGEPGGMIRSDR